MVYGLDGGPLSGDATEGYIIFAGKAVKFKNKRHRVGLFIKGSVVVWLVMLTQCKNAK